MPKLKTKASVGKQAPKSSKSAIKQSTSKPLDMDLVERLEAAMKGKAGISQRNMFGGVCFMHHGNMLCGVAKDKLVVRVGPEAYTSCLREKHVTEMTFTGRPMKGMIYVLPEATASTEGLKKWIEQGLLFTTTLKKK